MAFVDVARETRGTAERTLAVLTHVHVGNSRLQTLEGVMRRDNFARNGFLVGQFVKVADVQNILSCGIVVACGLSGVAVDLSVLPEVCLSFELLAARVTPELTVFVGQTEVGRNQKHGVVVLYLGQIAVVFRILVGGKDFGGRALSAVWRAWPRFVPSPVRGQVRRAVEYLAALRTPVFHVHYAGTTVLRQLKGVIVEFLTQLADVVANFVLDFVYFCAGLGSRLYEVVRAVNVPVVYHRSLLFGGQVPDDAAGNWRSSVLIKVNFSGRLWFFDRLVLLFVSSLVWATLIQKFWCRVFVIGRVDAQLLKT